MRHARGRSLLACRRSELCAPSCTRLYAGYTTPLTLHTSLGAVVVGVSCDPVETLVHFAEENGLEFPLLSDEVSEEEVACMLTCVCSEEEALYVLRRPRAALHPTAASLQHVLIPVPTPQSRTISLAYGAVKKATQNARRMTVVVSKVRRGVHATAPAFCSLLALTATITPV